MGRLRAFFGGELPLGEAFWWYGVVYGSFLNVLTTVLTLAVAAGQGPGWLVVGVYLLPVPYNLLALVGVWRSAAKWKGAPLWADLARVSIAFWAVVASLT